MVGHRRTTRGHEWLAIEATGRTMLLRRVSRSAGLALATRLVISTDGTLWDARAVKIGGSGLNEKWAPAKQMPTRTHGITARG